VADAVAEELVRRAAVGDAAARRRLVEATIDNLWALAMRLVRREDNADEIVQETYARALANLAYGKSRLVTFPRRYAYLDGRLVQRQ